jgi:8-oxo-dGTP pyrophosphatase MutT (NUDIX family)
MDAAPSVADLVLPVDWPQRLRAVLAAEPAPAHSAQVTGLMPEGSVTPAAVLLPIVQRAAGPMLLLTQRAGHLRQHAGQISFPGGRIEAADAGAMAAALRETHEEIGIEPRFVEPLGYLPGQLVLTGFSITPLVGLVQPGFVLRIDATEVADVFELPLAVVALERSFRVVPRQVRGVQLQLHELPWEGRVIWGATAAMLRNLGTVLRQALPGGAA